MERPRGDKKNVVGANHAVARVYRGSLDDGQDIALNAFARDVRSMSCFAAGYLVDFINKKDAHLFHAVNSEPRDLIHVYQAILFFLDQIIEGFRHGHLALLFLLAEEAGKHVLDVDVHFLDALIGDDFKGRHRALAHFHFHHALVEFSFAKLGAEFVAGTLQLFAALRFTGGTGIRRDRRWRQKKIQQAFLRGLFGALGYFIQLLFTHHVDGSFHQVAHHGFHIAANVSDFRVFRGFDFHKRAAGQTREAARNFRLSHAGRADHQNILWKDFFSKFGRKFLSTHAIAQRDGHRLLGKILAHDVFVQLDDDFSRRELVERGERLGLGRLRFTCQVDHHVFLRLSGHSSSMLKFALVKMQISL